MAEKNASSKKWLVRTDQGEFLGPFIFQDLKYHLLKKNIKPIDSACLPGERWKSLKKFAEFREVFRTLVPHSVDDKTHALDSTQVVDQKKTPEKVSEPPLSFIAKYRDHVLVSLSIVVVFLVLARFLNVKSGKNHQTSLHKKYEVRINQARDFEKSENYQKALGVYEAVFKEDPKYTEVSLSLGRTYYFLNEHVNARNFLVKLMSAKEPRYQKWAYLYLSLLDMKTDDYSGAITKLQKAKDIDENFLPALFNLGVCYFQKRELAQAKLYFETFFLGSSDFEPHFYLGQTYALLGDFKKAILELETVVRINPRFLDGYFLLAQSYYKTGQKSKAVSTFEEMFQLDPLYSKHLHKKEHYFSTDIPSHSKIAVYSDILFKSKPPFVKGVSRLGLLQFLAGDTAAGFKRVNEVLKNTRTDPLTYALLGFMHYQGADYTEALVALRKALRLDPDHFLSLLYLGRRALKNDSFDEAEGYFQKILELQPKSVEALDGLATVFKKRGDVKTASYYWKRSLEFDAQYLPAHRGLGSL